MRYKIDNENWIYKFKKNIRVDVVVNWEEENLDLLFLLKMKIKNNKLDFFYVNWYDVFICLDNLFFTKLEKDSNVKLEFENNERECKLPIVIKDDWVIIYLLVLDIIRKVLLKKYKNDYNTLERVILSLNKDFLLKLNREIEFEITNSEIKINFVNKNNEKINKKQVVYDKNWIKIEVDLNKIQKEIEKLF